MPIQQMDYNNSTIAVVKNYIHTIVYPRTSCTLNIMAKTPAARRCCMTIPASATRITFSIEASKTDAEYSTAGREYE